MSPVTQMFWYLLSHPIAVLLVLPAGVLLAHVAAWYLDEHDLRDIPGPKLAKFSDAWLGYWAAQGVRSMHVHEQHRKYGKVVRLAPNHVSLGDPAALQTVYAHGNGALKSNFYDAFVSIARGLFNTRSRSEHARKRKIVAHIFSAKNVRSFEANVHAAMTKFVAHFDRLCEGGKKGLSGDDGDSGWFGRDGKVWLDCLPWYNYLAFDVIGDLAFGEPFGMLDACQDIAAVAVSSAHYKGKIEQTHDTKYLPAAAILNQRGEFNASLGVLPPWVRPILRNFGWYARGNEAVKSLAGIAIAAVEKRLANPSAGERGDLLQKLQEAVDEEGKPMGKEELTAEALTQLIAGSDTTANSSCGITYFLAKNQAAQRKLQAELDAALGSTVAEDDPVVYYDAISKLPYLEACINEALRIHSNSAMGLAREVPIGGMEVLGRFYNSGTVLSVPSYTIHRDPEVWGDDVEEYRPERWFERDPQAMQQTFNPFSFGPRACVGKNLASLEVSVIIATVFHRYDVVLENPDEPMKTREGFLRKPVRCRVGIRRRELL